MLMIVTQKRISLGANGILHVVENYAIIGRIAIEYINKRQV